MEDIQKFLTAKTMMIVAIAVAVDVYAIASKEHAVAAANVECAYSSSYAVYCHGLEFF